MTFGEALAEGRAALAAADNDGGTFDARVLLAAAAGLDMAALIARDGETLPGIALAAYRSYVTRRLKSEPVARILGAAEFWGLSFRLNAATLVPRPDTEILVEAVLEEARCMPPNIALADLGTGSGAIAIALLSELPEASAVATDISEEALQAARANALKHGVADRVRFERCDFAKGPDVPFDVVVANPPYIRSDTIATLAPAVRDFDPRVALDGGADGLDAYRSVLSRVGRLLKEGGVFAVEVGADQGDAVADLCRKAGLSKTQIRLDLSGRQRVVSAHRTSSVADLKVAKKALGKVE